MSTESKKTRDATVLHNELGHPLEDIIPTTRKAMGFKVTGTFQVCDACIFRKAKKSGVSKLALVCSKIKSECLFFNISSPSTPCFGGKRHWLLFMETSNNYMWSYLKQKSGLKAVMISLPKDLQTTHGITIKIACFIMQE